MSLAVVAPIVEGHGEVNAVRDLIVRIAADVSGEWVQVMQPFRLDSAKMRKPDELAKAVRFQAARVTGRGGVLVLRDGDDSDENCPVKLARMIAPPAELVSVPVEIVIARYEYEAWFLAAIESLRGHPAVLDDAEFSADPESKRDAKGQLSRMMSTTYRETLHQAKFSALMDLGTAARNSRSFRRMTHAVQLLLEGQA